MYKITLQENYTGNNPKRYDPFSRFHSSEKYLWLNNPYTEDDVKQEKANKTAAAGIIFMAAILLMMSKNFQSGSQKLLEKLNELLNKKYDAAFLKEAKPKTNIRSYIARKIDTFLKKSESLNNITSLKDILFMRLMYKTEFTRKIHSGITNFFADISVNTVKKSYKKTAKLFDDMYEKFDKLDEYILRHYSDKTVKYKEEEISVPKLIEKAKECRESIKIVVNAFINEDTQKARYNLIKETTSSLYSSFWNESFKGFWTKDNKFKRKEMWQTFIASEQIKANKTQLAEETAFTRNILSYTTKEKAKYISGYIENLKSIVPIEDAEGLEILNRLEWYTQNASGLTDGKDNFLLELEKFEKHQLKLSGDENLIKLQLKDRASNIQMIRDMANDNDTGELGDMLNIYRKIALFELSKSGALNATEEAVSSFDKSVQLEIGELFDKFRDLELGSAPTDILTLVFSSGMIIFGLGKAKNDKEKTSVMLKSGIPVIGGIATTMISATKLISGGKSLALGFLSGLILNRIGTIADNLNKKMKRQKSGVNG